jgi:hypothetical protein
MNSLSDVECKHCGHSYSADDDDFDDGNSTCPSCGAENEAAQHPPIGAETAIHPQLLRGSEMYDDSTGTDGAETGPVKTSQTTAIDVVDSPRDPEPAEPILKGYLLRIGTVEPGPTIPLAGEKTVVGRVQANITVDDPTVSGKHFEITVRDDEFFLRDLNSTHGTFLNGSRIESAQIKTQDVIRAGESEFLFTTMEVIPLR